MRILWVEDELHIVGVDVILEHAIVDTAMSCDLAIAKLKTTSYDLIIMDLILPITLGAREMLPFQVTYLNKHEERYAGLWLVRYIRNELKIETPIMVFTIVVGRDRKPIERLLHGQVQGYVSKYDTMPSDLWGTIQRVLACQDEGQMECP